MKRSRGSEEHLEPDAQPGNVERFSDPGVDLQPVSKITELDSAVEDESDEFAMKCSLPPHKEPLAFRSYGDYESHYHNFHSNRCLNCRKNFPTEHLLGIHIEECHDPLARVAREKGEHTYSCFVEGCERKCMTPQKRRLHLIDKHMYPKNFFFAVTKDGIDGRRSLLIEGGHRRRSSSGAQSQSKEYRRRANTAEHEAPHYESSGNSPSVTKPTTDDIGKAPGATDDDMADLTCAMSALQFVPSSIRFGRGRAGFLRK